MGQGIGALSISAPYWAILDLSSPIPAGILHGYVGVAPPLPIPSYRSPDGKP